MLKNLLLVLVISLTSFIASASDTATYKITLINQPNWTPNLYLEGLLVEAFRRQNKQLQIEYITEKINTKRLTQLLSENRGVNLAWLNTSHDLEQKLRAIKVPLYRGVHGKRILLVNNEVKDKISKITTLAELTSFLGLQYHAWSDYDVLVHNGLNIEGQFGHSAMIKALNEKIGDYAPRSAMTINKEFKKYGTENISIEENLLLEYPAYIYFFTSKENEALAQVIEAGLVEMSVSGELDKRFNHYSKGRLQDLNIPSRRVIKLSLPPIE